MYNFQKLEHNTILMLGIKLQKDGGMTGSACSVVLCGADGRYGKDSCHHPYDYGISSTRVLSTVYLVYRRQDL